MQISKLSDRFLTKNNESADFQNVKSELEAETIQVQDDSLYESLLEKVNTIPYWNEYDYDKKLNMVKNFVKNLDFQVTDETFENLMSYVVGFGSLQNLLDNEKVNAVFVNDINSVHIEISGRVFDTEIKLSKSMLQYILNFIGERAEKVYSCRIADYIVDVIKPDVCLNGVNISIRKIKSFDINSLIQAGMLTDELYNFLAEKIENKKRIVIAGGINSGKSTFLDTLVQACLSNKRCYIFEKSGQLSADGIKFDVLKHDYTDLLSMVQKSMPDYIISDLNTVDDIALISTLRADSIENAFQILVSKYSDMSDKYAKLKVLNDFDYIVYLDDYKITSVVELKPAKTMALSVNVVYEL